MAFRQLPKRRKLACAYIVLHADAHGKVSLFFADKNTWILALECVHKGDLTDTLPRTRETAASKVYSTCAAVYLSRSLRAGPDKATVTSLTQGPLPAPHSQPRLGLRQDSTPLDMMKGCRSNAPIYVSTENRSTETPVQPITMVRGEKNRPFLKSANEQIRLRSISFS